jgi:hypothetical protein
MMIGKQYIYSSVPNISGIMGWAGHVALMGKMRNTNFLAENLEVRDNL